MSPIRDGLIARTFSLVIAALSAGVLGWMLNSPVFDIRNISVHRAESSPPPAVNPTVVKSFAESFEGRNAFRINTAHLRDQLLQLPGVADVLVRAGIDGRLTITVSYEAPVANWRVGDQSYLVNAEGEVLAANYLKELPLTIWDNSRTVLSPGDLVNVDALFAAHQLKSNLLHLRLEAKKILHHVGGLSITDHAGRVIEFGNTKHLEGKLVALHAVLEQAKQQGERITSVDLRPIDRPTYRTADSGSKITSITGSQP